MAVDQEPGSGREQSALAPQVLLDGTGVIPTNLENCSMGWGSGGGNGGDGDVLQRGYPFSPDPHG